MRNLIPVRPLAVVVFFGIFFWTSCGEREAGVTANSSVETAALKSAPVVLTEENFEGEVLQSAKPVLVDFWAEWCAPCRIMSPILEEISHDYSGQVKVGKVDVDEQEEIAERYDVYLLPTLLFFQGGKVVDEVIGLASREELDRKIEALQ